MARLAAMGTICLATTAIAKENLDGKFVSAKTGDTITIEAYPTGIRGRITCKIASIAAPVLSSTSPQLGARDATKFLGRYLDGKEISLALEETDKKTVCTATVSGEDIGAVILYNGHAWFQDENILPVNRDYYIALEAAAKESRRGLWARTNPTPPWEHIKMLKGLRRH